jgi:hypothetical protein
MLAYSTHVATCLSTPCPRARTCSPHQPSWRSRIYMPPAATLARCVVAAIVPSRRRPTHARSQLTLAMAWSWSVADLHPGPPGPWPGA